MTIKEQLAQELRDAIKTGDAVRRDAVRQIETEIALARSEKGFSGQVDDDLYRRVIASYVKKMEKARGEYEELGERGGVMAAKLAAEVEYLSHWLPGKLDEAATEALALEVIAELGVAGDEKAAGRVIGHLMKTRGDDLDGALASRVVKRLLG